MIGVSQGCQDHTKGYMHCIHLKHMTSLGTVAFAFPRILVRRGHLLEMHCVYTAQVSALNVFSQRCFLLTSTGCPKGTYGPHCRKACQCLNGGHCDTVTGACDCLPGFIGADCGKSKCLSRPASRPCTGHEEVSSIYHNDYSCWHTFKHGAIPAPGEEAVGLI